MTCANYSIPAWADNAMLRACDGNFIPECKPFVSDGITSYSYDDTPHGLNDKLESYLNACRIPFTHTCFDEDGDDGDIKRWVHCDTTTIDIYDATEKKIDSDGGRELRDMVRNKDMNGLEAYFDDYSVRNLPHPDFNIEEVKPSSWTKLTIALTDSCPETVREICDYPDDHVVLCAEAGLFQDFMRSAHIVSHEDVKTVVQAAARIIPNAGSIESTDPATSNQIGWGTALIRDRLDTNGFFNELISLLWEDDQLKRFQQQALKDLPHLCFANHQVSFINKLIKSDLLPVDGKSLEQLAAVFEKNPDGDSALLVAKFRADLLSLKANDITETFQEDSLASENIKPLTLAI